jgi:hypothetical protein
MVLHVAAYNTAFITTTAGGLCEAQQQHLASGHSETLPTAVHEITLLCTIDLVFCCPVLLPAPSAAAAVALNHFSSQDIFDAGVLPCVAGSQCCAMLCKYLACSKQDPKDNKEHLMYLACTAAAHLA